MAVWDGAMSQALREAMLHASCHCSHSRQNDLMSYYMSRFVPVKACYKSYLGVQAMRKNSVLNPYNAEGHCPKTTLLA